jgi:hypothetical protein
LANTYEMLASTVQFSRYGRSRPHHALSRALQPVLVEGEPSGRSLRTQQRARPTDPSLPRSIPPRRAY